MFGAGPAGDPKDKEASMSARRTRCLITALLGFCLAAQVPPALGQQQLGALQGTITDATKAVLPGVVVSVTNTDTGAVRSTVTNSAGVYRIPSLEPGSYQVSAELQGFRKAVRADVVLSVGATLGINLQLEPGGVAETVEVAGTAPEIQTEKAEVSAVVERKKITDLPLVGRNVFQLAALQPGLNAGLPGTSGTADFLAPEQGTGVQASGMRGSAASATVDGTSIDGGPWGGTVLLVPNVEAVQEFQVIANNPSAEYGRNAGVAISIITRGGTNELRGSLYDFHRNEGLRARNIFETGVKPDFKRNDFGGSVGGPLRKDRTFFFASYEGVRETTGRGVLRTVETREFVDFVVRTRPNSKAAKLLQTYKPIQYPTTDLRDLGSPAPGANVWNSAPDGIPDVGTISIAAIGERQGDQFSTRLDHVFGGGRDRLRGTYYVARILETPGETRPQFRHPFPDHLNHIANLSHTRTLSAETLNEFSFGFSRMHGEAADPTPESPTISITGLSVGFGVVFWHPITFTQNNFQLKDTLTMNRGRHSFRIGGELRLGQDDSVLHHWERPTYGFASILDFADDEVFSEQRAVDPSTGLPTNAPAKYRTREFGLFVQDNWKLRPNLTLNLGLRYENFGNPKKDRPFNGIVLGPGATRQEQMRTARVATIDKIHDTDWNNVAPRLGMSWDPGSNQKLVLRAGGGVSYNRINNTVFSDERLNPPVFANATANIFSGIPLVYSLGPSYTPNPALGRGLDERGGIRGARVSLRVVDPGVRTPHYYNWFAGAQRQLPARFVVDVNYIGSAGRKLMSGDGPGGENYNRFAGDLIDGRFDGLNPSFLDVGLAESRISSSYHGMTAQLSRRHRKGFGFQAAYTLGKATDTAGSAIEVTRPDLDRGPTGSDVRHRLALNVLWEIPSPQGSLERVLGGWQLNAITIWQTGTPFSVFCGLPYPRCDFNADGTNNDRPNVPAFGDSKRGLGNDDFLAGIFTAADFPLPAAGTLGNLGRNTFRGPGYFNTDLSLFKNVQVAWFGSRQATLQLRVEAFNVFNKVNLFNPASNTNSTLFGRSTAARQSRDIQLGVKFLF
jgi:hypothetical protein